MSRRKGNASSHRSGRVVDPRAALAELEFVQRVATDAGIFDRAISKPQYFSTKVWPAKPPVNLDARTFHPAGKLRPAPAFNRSARRLVPARPKRAPLIERVAERIGFAAPLRVLVCVRRKMRRQVIFAKRFHGKGAGARRKLNRWSSIKC